MVLSVIPSLHPGSLLKGHHIRGDLNVGFQNLIKLTAVIAIPEMGYMPELLRFIWPAESPVFARYSHGILNGWGFTRKRLGM